MSSGPGNQHALPENKKRERGSAHRKVNGSWKSCPQHTNLLQQEEKNDERKGRLERELER